MPLEQVVVSISGPVEVKPASVRVDVPARTEVIAEIALRPSEPGIGVGRVLIIRFGDAR